MEGLTGLFLLSSGLFLGWNLGANDAANIMGSAVGSQMLSFRRAAIIGAIFVVLGAATGGLGGSHTLGRLGTVANINAAFALALGAAITLFLFTRLGLPVSTSQAIVGSIIGWNFFSRAATDWSAMANIAISWVASPIFAAILSVILYVLMRVIMRRLRVHLFRWDGFLRFALAAAGAYGAFSLGTNNIANVMGVFLPVVPFSGGTIGPLTLEPGNVLYLLGGIAIAAGILTYSQKVMDTLGSDIIHLSPENALVVVIAISTVLLLFSSPWLPRVPVSSSQAAVGAVLGIGLVRGVRGIRYRVLGKIAVGWILTPLGAGVITFVLLNILRNLFAMELL